MNISEANAFHDLIRSLRRQGNGPSPEQLHAGLAGIEYLAERARDAVQAGPTDYSVHKLLLGVHKKLHGP